MSNLTHNFKEKGQHGEGMLRDPVLPKGQQGSQELVGEVLTPASLTPSLTPILSLHSYLISSAPAPFLKKPLSDFRAELKLNVMVLIKFTVYLLNICSAWQT